MEVIIYQIRSTFLHDFFLQWYMYVLHEQKKNMAKETAANYLILFFYVYEYVDLKWTRLKGKMLLFMLFSSTQNGHGRGA